MNDNNNGYINRICPELGLKYYIFLVFVGLRFHSIMIVLKKIQDVFTSLFLRFQSNLDSIWEFSDGYRWFQTSYSRF